MFRKVLSKKPITTVWQDPDSGVWLELTSRYLGILASLPSIGHSAVYVFAPPETEASSHREQRAAWPLNSHSLPSSLVLRPQSLWGETQQLLPSQSSRLYSRMSRTGLYKDNRLDMAMLFSSEGFADRGVMMESTLKPHQWPVSTS